MKQICGNVVFFIRQQKKKTKKNNENDSNAFLNYVAEVILFKRMNKLSKNQILIVQLQHVIKKPKFEYIFEYCMANILEAKEYI